MVNFTEDKIKDWKKQKPRIAVLLRSSAGKKVKLEEQKKIMEEWVRWAIDRKLINPKFDFEVRGVSFRKVTGQKRLDLDKRGDFWNEGITSGFSIDTRPVLAALFEKIADGFYDAVIVYDYERIARNYNEFVYLTYLPIQEDDAQFYDVLNNQLYNQQTPLLERLGIILGLEFGAEKKKGEAKKAQATVDLKVLKGYARGQPPDMGQPIKAGGRAKDYDLRKVWYAMLSNGTGNKHTSESPHLANANTLAARFGNTTVRKLPSGNFTEQGNGAWALNLFRKWWQINEAGKWDDWIDLVEALQKKGKAAKGEKQKEKFFELMDKVSGWLYYPLGVYDPLKELFIEYPNPMEIGLDKIENADDPRLLDGFEVKVTEEIPETILQSQLTKKFQNWTNPLTRKEILERAEKLRK